MLPVWYDAEMQISFLLWENLPGKMERAPFQGSLRLERDLLIYKSTPDGNPDAERPACTC